MVGRGPVRVQPERPTSLRLARPIEPESRVLAGRRRPHQCRDRQPAGPTHLESAEPLPDSIVERPLHMTRDDRVPPVQYVTGV